MRAIETGGGCRTSGTRILQKVKNHKLIAMTLIAMCFTPVAYLAGHTLLRPAIGARGAPYLDPAEIIRSVNSLPTIELHVQNRADWDSYVEVARHLRSTKPEIITAALRQLCTDHPSFRDKYKLMILLRVSFDCRRASTGSATSRGWISQSQAAAGRTSRGPNWPVSYCLGRFTLVDSIDGHLGKPYDASAEFAWMLQNCGWRE